MKTSLGAAALLFSLFCTRAYAQFPPGKQGSPNMHIVAHLPLGPNKTTSDIELEQELSHQWGMPNVSSAQDWDNGPDGAPKIPKVS